MSTPDGFIKIRVVGEIHGIKFYREASVLFEMWAEFTPAQQEKFARDLVLGDIKTSFAVQE